MMTSSTEGSSSKWCHGFIAYQGRYCCRMFVLMSGFTPDICDPDYEGAPCQVIVSFSSHGLTLFVVFTI